MDANGVREALERFRANRREFTRLVGLIPSERRLAPAASGEWSARDVVAHVAAWIDEANDRIPRLLAGAPPAVYDVDAFNAAAVARATGWTPDQAMGAFRRAADRFEAIIGESDAEEIAGCPDAVAWLRGLADRVMTEHFADLTRLAGGAGLSSEPPSA